MKVIGGLLIVRKEVCGVVAYDPYASSTNISAEHHRSSRRHSDPFFHDPFWCYGNFSAKMGSSSMNG